jgi:hypothetical protein
LLVAVALHNSKAAVLAAWSSEPLKPHRPVLIQSLSAQGVPTILLTEQTVATVPSSVLLLLAAELAGPRVPC